MKKLFLFLALMPVLAFAEIVQPVHWSGKQVGDSIRLTAKIDKGFHMTIFQIGDQEFEPWDAPEYVGTYTITVAEPTPITYNACNDQMCIAKETYLYKPKKQKEEKPAVEVAEEAPVVDSAQAVADSLVKDTVAAAPAPVVEAVAEIEEEEQSPEGKSLFWIFFMGMLAGLLAIFTPCVWPIIPMTVSFFIKRNGAQRGTTNGQAIRDAFFYGLSIIIIYVGLGLLITAVFGASALNAMSTNAVVNIIFFLILVVFAASFFGAFELTLPSSWSTKLNDKSRSSSGFLSIMFMAFTLVIVSFSCTGPIIGTLLVEAAGKSLLAPTIGMLGFAIALALPFSLFAMFPTVLQKLPKSGGWMNTFKVTLAFIELALSLKFLSVADLAYGWHILDREVFIALWVVIFALLGLYLIGLVSFKGDDEDHKKTSVTRFFLGTISLAFATYLLPGLWGAPLKAVSAFAPPMYTQDWVMTPGQATAAVDNQQKSVHFTDYAEGLAYAQEHDMPVILDFTGFGCVNCRKMEANVLDLPQVQERLAHYVFISLYVDDKHMLPDNSESIGDFNSRIQREKYNANAQPFFVQLDNQGNQIGDTHAFSTDVDEFLQWLKY
ncbi:MAG: thioredoxin family protein [Paludibacteraceae bacterium]|nr:thioredoxin family protein [Paludibacteraceae bacterium]